jgi:hypothetical protein
MLADDVHIEQSKGEWLGFDFENESLNFTAEFVGPVTSEQVAAFHAAFDGTTSLRRTTIGQFARIADAIAEDELIGFGLYLSDSAAEPSDWRCLSRRDALRIAEELKLLSQGGAEQESKLPAVTGKYRAFGRPREDDASLAERLTRVERQVEEHSAHIRDLRSQSAATEESFRNLLSAVETFCDQATHQIEKISPATLPPATALAPPSGSRRWVAVSAAAVLAVAIVFVAARLWMARPAESAPKVVVAAPPPAPPPEPEPKPRPRSMQIELSASELTWVSVTDADGNKLLTRALGPGDVRNIEVDRPAHLRTGNAGGLRVTLDGKPLGNLGPRGKVREIDFKDGEFKITAPE